MDKKFEFSPDKIEKVLISDVFPNNWNPKEATPREMENIKKSLEINGYAQPILAREKDNGYEIIDGFHRYSVLKDLGYKELYIYNAGKISDEDAKAMTIWMQTQVEFDEKLLAPLAIELNKLDIELPYTNQEMVKFENMAFDMNTGEVKEDALVEVDETEPPKSKLGEIYHLGEHRLMCGDSTDPETSRSLCKSLKES